MNDHKPLTLPCGTILDNDQLRIGHLYVVNDSCIGMLIDIERNNGFLTFVMRFIGRANNERLTYNNAFRLAKVKID